jgi:hypothetical protein
MGQWEMIIQDDNTKLEINIYMIKQTREVSYYLSQDGIKKFDPEKEVEPLLKIKRDSQDIFQAMADGLYERGITPKARRFNEEMKLKDDHLQDMRKLVFKDKTKL